MTDIYDLKKKIYDYVISLQSDPALIDEFKQANEVYTEVLKLNSREEIKTYYENFYDKCINHPEYKEYQELLDSLKGITDKTERNKVHVKLNTLARRINARHNILIFINNYLEKTKEVTKDEQGVDDISEPIEEQKEEEKKPSPVDHYVDFSNNIIKLLDRYYSLDKNTSEAEKLRNTINEALEYREESLTSKFGDVVLINLSVIESLEERVSRLPKLDKLERYSVTSEQFVGQIRTILNKINDFDFNGINSKYFEKDNSKSDGINENRLFKEREQLVRTFHNMIASVFGEDKNIEGLDGATFDDIIPMLSTCNLEGGYKEFKDKFKNKRIGSETITKDMYEDRLRKINLCIDYLCNKAAEIIKSKGNSVIISNHQKTRDDLLGEIRKEHEYMLVNMLNEMRKNNKSVGEEDVHRQNY